jgi:hypothetical protein
MRALQIVLFVAGVIVFVAAVFFIGQGTGDTLWRAGVAIMLTAIACKGIGPAKSTS